MKNYFFIMAILLFAACSTRKQTTQTTVITKEIKEPEDSIVYVKTPLEFEQKDQLPLLLGSWNLLSMQRQTKLPVESLSNYSLTLHSGGHFTSNTYCGTISGNYSVKGMSIKFNDVKIAWNSCNNNGQVNELIRLLQNTVSMYTVDNSSLTLQDNSSNVIFRAGKK